VTAYVANHQKKKRIFEKREKELLHLIKNGSSYEKIIKSAEKPRVARLAIFKSEYSRLSILPAHTYQPDVEAKHWEAISADEIV
jgi:hypothetical protein